jgi:hypothetical protein
MANLKTVEKISLEKYFDMDIGYVCNFSNRIFKDFVFENAGIDIYTKKYAQNGESKANRLRIFWKEEQNHIVGKLLAEMINYWKVQKATPLPGYRPFNQVLYDECKRIADRISKENGIKNIDALTPNSDDKDFELLSQSIKELIRNNHPEQALDRLHTFVFKYIRTACTKHQIKYEKNMPLHGLFGAYIKFLKAKGFIESEMSKVILMSSIKIFESFNFVRNNQSLAHDNKISNTIGFIDFIERKIEINKKGEVNLTYEDYEIEKAGDWWMQHQLDITRGK